MTNKEALAKDISNNYDEEADGNDLEKRTQVTDPHQA